MKNFIIPQGKKLLFPFQDVVLIRNLTKVFGGGGWKTKKRLRRLFRRGNKEKEEVGSGCKVAVDNISVGIRRGEVKKMLLLVFECECWCVSYARLYYLRYSRYKPCFRVFPSSFSLPENKVFVAL